MMARRSKADNAALDAIVAYRRGFQPDTYTLRLARRSTRYRGYLLGARLEFEERPDRPKVAT